MLIRDVAGVRNTYPTLLPTGTDGLKSKVRLQKLLIGYRVGLKITVADTGMWKSIYKFVEDAKKNKGGGFSIFGFRMLYRNPLEKRCMRLRAARCPSCAALLSLKCLCDIC